VLRTANQRREGRQMPIYAYRCESCGNEFDVFSKAFQVKAETCPQCGSSNTRKLLTAPLVRVEEPSSSTSEYAKKDEPVEYYRKKGRFDLAAKEAEKLGKSEWEIRRIREGKKP